jgi:hypothetical protein
MGNLPSKQEKMAAAKWHRWGRMIHRSALSAAFRTPTALNSTDLQCEQRVKNTVTLTSFQSVGLRRATASLELGYFGMTERIYVHCLRCSGRERAACRPFGLDLFRCP